MHRLFGFLLLLAAAGCAWPPGGVNAPIAPNAAEPVAQTAEGLPRLPQTQLPSVPRVAPPAISVPRAGGGIL